MAALNHRMFMVSWLVTRSSPPPSSSRAQAPTIFSRQLRWEQHKTDIVCVLNSRQLQLQQQSWECAAMKRIVVARNEMKNPPVFASVGCQHKMTQLVTIFKQNDQCGWVKWMPTREKLDAKMERGPGKVEQVMKEREQGQGPINWGLDLEKGNKSRSKYSLSIWGSLSPIKCYKRTRKCRNSD